jgi:hypothetical protein
MSGQLSTSGWARCLIECGQGYPDDKEIAQGLVGSFIEDIHFVDIFHCRLAEIKVEPSQKTPLLASSLTQKSTLIRKSL